MRAFWIVCVREITIRLRSWRFWVGTLSFPVLIFIVMGWPALAKYFAKEKELQVLVVGKLPLPAQSEGFRFIGLPEASADSLQALLKKGEEELMLLILPKDPLISEACTLYTTFSLSADRTETLKSILTEAFQAYRQQALRVTSEALSKVLTPPQLRVLKLSSEGAERYSAGLATVVGIFTGIVLFILLTGAGYQILASVVEEKSNRLVEYLLLSAEPIQIMRGKVAAGLALSFFQVIVWGLTLPVSGHLTFSLSPISEDPQKERTFVEALQMQLFSVPWGWVIAFLLFGLLLYAFLYAAAGATSDSITELSPISQALQWPLILSVIVLPSLVAVGEGPILTVLSYFPLTSPMYMPVRLIATTVPGWEAPLSLAILIATAWVTERLAARLYQHALLLYGQKLSWKTIWQLIRG